MGPTVGWNSLLIELFWLRLCSNGSGRAESDFGLKGWIDTLRLKEIFLIFSVVLSCPSTSWGIYKSCCRKSDSSSTSCNKKFTCCAFYRPKANLYCSKWRRSLVWRDSREILSNQKSVFTQLATRWFVTRQVFATSPPSEVFLEFFPKR